MKPVISLRDVTKVYISGQTETRAVENVSIDFWPGEMALLMGPSGSGKTTLLSIMGCLLRATSGMVSIAGLPVTHLDEQSLPDIRLRHVGFVFQHFNLFNTLSVEENLRIILELKGIHGR